MAKHQRGGIRYKYYYAHLDKYPFELYYNIILYGKRYGLTCDTWQSVDGSVIILTAKL